MTSHCTETTMRRDEYGDVHATTAAERAFNAWLEKNGFKSADDVCPVDTESGSYVGAKDAWDLVYDFLADNPRFESRYTELRDYAVELGQLANTF
jgi:hypothetical protein